MVIFLENEKICFWLNVIKLCKMKSDIVQKVAHLKANIVISKTWMTMLAAYFVILGQQWQYLDENLIILEAIVFAIYTIKQSFS